MSIITMPTIVLIVCLSHSLPEADPNSAYTGHENRDWTLVDSKMQCRPLKLPVGDPTEAQGADPQPFNNQRCMSSAISIATHWDLSNKSSKYRVWRIMCPAPVIDTQTGKFLGWNIPDGCGHEDTVTCESDTSI